MVKARVTSAKKRSGDRLRGMREREPRLLREKQKLKPTHAPTGSRCRDGVEKSYFVCQTTGADSPATLLDFPPGESWPARIADQSAVRAGAGGSPKRATVEKIARRWSLDELRCWRWCTTGLLRLWRPSSNLFEKGNRNPRKEAQMKNQRTTMFATVNNKAALEENSAP